MGLEMSWPQNSEVTLAVFSRIQTRKERHAESVGRNLRKLSSSLGSSTSLAHSSQCPREPDISQGQGIRTVGAKANSVGPCPQAASSKFSGGSRQQPDKHQHVSIHNCKVIERWGCRARRLYSRGVTSRWGGNGGMAWRKDCLVPRDYPFIQQILTEHLFCAKHINEPKSSPSCGLC